MKVQALSVEETFASLLSSPAGLDAEEAARRLAEYGANEIRELKVRSLPARLAAQFTHFLALLLWCAAALCFVSEYLHPGEGLFRLGMAILAVILINALFTFFQEYRTEKAVQELRKLLPFRVAVIRNGSELQVDGKMIVPGDLIILREGDKVPVDARVVHSSRLTANNAPLTGEADFRVLSDAADEDELLQSRNLVFAGTLIVSGSGRAVAYATGMATEFGKIAHITGRVAEVTSPLQVELNRVTRLVAVIAVLSGACFFAIGSMIGRSFWQNFLFAIGIIIASVPEGLLPTVTLSLAMGSRRMARRNALVKNLSAVEALGSVDLICTDKTGTLTQNRMTVRELTCQDDGAMACLVALLCNNAVLCGEEINGDPTETALYRYARGRISVSGERLGEIPFDADRRRMTTLHRVAGRKTVLVKGAAESVLPLCTALHARGGDLFLDMATRGALEEQHRALAGRGLRVICLAYRSDADDLPDISAEGEIPEEGLIFAGFMGLEDPPRPEVAAALTRCRSAGIRVIMITGDAGATAAAIAGEIGLTEGDPLIIEGRECAALPDEELAGLCTRDNLIFARMSPQHKMHVVSLLMEAGHRVAVTGDGVNDAPALKKAHVGIAMGLSGTSVAREAADIVLLDDNFASIVHAIEEGRAVFENIRSFITYIFASNIPELLPYIAYILFGIPLPLTIMQILAVDLGTDMLPALALGSEKPSPEIMHRPPRPAGEHLVTKDMLARAFLFLGFIEALAGMSAYFYVMLSAGWNFPHPVAPAGQVYLQATTACLAGIIVTQIANAFACRSPRISITRLGFLSNRLLLGGICSELILAVFIIYTPTGNALFACAPLTIDVWLLLLPFALLLLLVDELRKTCISRPAGP